LEQVPPVFSSWLAFRTRIGLAVPAVIVTVGSLGVGATRSPF
jgi:hypothetical protein